MIFTGASLVAFTSGVAHKKYRLFPPRTNPPRSQNDWRPLASSRNASTRGIALRSFRQVPIATRTTGPKPTYEDRSAEDETIRQERS